MSLVNVSIVGNVVRTPEQRQFDSGRSKTTITVAVSTPPSVKSSAGEKWETEYYKVETWGKLADVASKYLNKGSHFGATGRLILDRWQDKDGRDRVTPTIRAEQISLPPSLRVVQAEEVISGETFTRDRNLSDEAGSENEFDELLGLQGNPDFVSEPVPITEGAVNRKRQ